MKLLFKPALTGKWPSGKGLGRCLNRDGDRFIVIRFAATSRACKRGSWVAFLNGKSDTGLGPSSWTQAKASSYATEPG